MVECWFHMNRPWPTRPWTVFSFKMETRANVFLFLCQWRGRAAMGGAGRFFCATNSIDCHNGFRLERGSGVAVQLRNPRRKTDWNGG